MKGNKNMKRIAQNTAAAALGAIALCLTVWAAMWALSALVTLLGL